MGHQLHPSPRLTGVDMNAESTGIQMSFTGTGMVVGARDRHTVGALTDPSIHVLSSYI